MGSSYWTPHLLSQDHTHTSKQNMLPTLPIHVNDYLKSPLPTGASWIRPEVQDGSAAPSLTATAARPSIDRFSPLLGDDKLVRLKKDDNFYGSMRTMSIRLPARTYIPIAP